MAVVCVANTAHADDAKPEPAVEPTPPVPTTVNVEAKPVAQNLPTRFSGKKLVWDERFTRVDTLQLAVIGAGAAVALATNVAHPRDTGWRNPTGFDESVRNALRFKSYTGRSRARDASDVSLSVLTAFPFVVDTLIVAYWYRGSEDVARQMFLIDAEVVAVTTAIQGSVTMIAGRYRPYVADCGTAELPSNTIDCDSTTRFRSFFSGHSAQAFASAALICSHHLSLDLFESSADEITCALGLTAAAATAALRVMGDMHYATDVLAGAAVGTAVGLGLPWIHHYRRAKQTDEAHVTVVPTVGGVAAVGAF